MCVACEPGMRAFTRLMFSRRSVMGGTVALAATRAWAAGPFYSEADSSAASEPRGTRRADMILVNANVRTMDRTAPRARAIAIAGGRVLGVGTLREMEALKGPDTRVVDMGGKTVMPGFIDAHMHFSSVILDDFVSASADKVPTIAALSALLRDASAKTPAGSWVRLKWYDPSIMQERRAPTLAELDAAAPDHPVFILESNGHNAYVNSAALKLAGVSNDSKDPPQGRFVRSDDGKLSGRLEEGSAFMPFVVKMPAVAEPEMTQRAMNLAKLAASVGCTMVHDCGIGSAAGAPELARLQNISANSAPVRIRGMLVSTYADLWDKMGLKPGVGNERLRIDGVKAWSDGSNQGLTGYQREPYLGSTSRGALNYTPEQLAAAIRRAHKDGWQVGVHANGDAAIDVTIDAYRKVLAELPRADHRYRIEHCSILHPEQIKAMHELGLSPSFLIGHVRIWGKAFQDRILGPERAKFYDPCKTAMEGGLTISLHSDYDVTPIEPLQMVETAVTRTMSEGGGVLNPAERLTREQAFRAITINPAWQLGEEMNAGTIESGKWADLVVLGEDPFVVDANRISKVPVVETWLGGVRQAKA